MPRRRRSGRRRLALRRGRAPTRTARLRDHSALIPSRIIRLRIILLAHHDTNTYTYCVEVMAMAKRVLCDTCHVRTVEVGQEYDGTEYIACAVCLGDEEASEPIVTSEEDEARALRVDALIHADLEAAS